MGYARNMNGEVIGHLQEVLRKSRVLPMDVLEGLQVQYKCYSRWLMSPRGASPATY